MQQGSPPRKLGLLGLVWGFPKIGVPYFGVLIVRVLLFDYLGYHIRVPYFRKLPCGGSCIATTFSAARDSDRRCHTPPRPWMAVGAFFLGQKLNRARAGLRSMRLWIFFRGPGRLQTFR